MTLAPLARQDPSFFIIPCLAGTGCGTLPRPTLEALPRKSMSGCVCTRWTSLLCRGRRTPSKSYYSVSPSTRSDLCCIALLLNFLGPPFARCKGNSAPYGSVHCPRVTAGVCCHHTGLVVWYWLTGSWRKKANSFYTMLDAMQCFPLLQTLRTGLLKSDEPQ